MYTEIDGDEKQIWVNSSDADQVYMEMNTDGTSKYDVYLKPDIKRTAFEVDENGIVDDAYGSNVYESFIDNLRTWNSDIYSTEGTLITPKLINDYAFIPYDWRMSLHDVVHCGVVYPGEKLKYSCTHSTPLNDTFIIKKLSELATTSKTGKVTIVAHSNGGLVAKELIQTLKETNNPLYHKIDNLILVAVPQEGTSDAVAALLHGSELGEGFVMGKERFRYLALNMPMSYNLLPTSSQLSNLSNIIVFGNALLGSNVANYYYPNISTYLKLTEFITDSTRRFKPIYENVNIPEIGNSALLTQAQVTHARIDNFEPAPETVVHQIAGWGVYTPSRFKYDNKLICIDADDDSLCESYVRAPAVYQELTMDGDSTVLSASALSGTSNRLWVNLEEYNKSLLGTTLNRKHKDIFEVNTVRDYIKSVVTNSYSSLEYITTQKPTTSTTYLKYTLHSPLDIKIVDTQNNIVLSKDESTIPNGQYGELGDSKYVILPADYAHTVILDAYAKGSFTLDVETLLGDTNTGKLSFAAIPNKVDTIASMSWTPAQGLQGRELKVDFDGNGSVDRTLSASVGNTLIYDTRPPELKIEFNTQTKDVVFKAVDDLDPAPTMTVTPTTITLTDNQGNTTVVAYSKYKEPTTKLMFTYQSISRNGVATPTPSTSITYDWKLDPQDNLKDLDTTVTLQGIQRHILKYKKNNITTILTNINNIITTTTRIGFVPVTVITTPEGILVVSY